jgi:hypothetical protein
MPLLDRAPLLYPEAPADELVARPIIEIDHKVTQRIDITAEAGQLPPDRIKPRGAPQVGKFIVGCDHLKGAGVMVRAFERLDAFEHQPRSATLAVIAGERAAPAGKFLEINPAQAGRWKWQRPHYFRHNVCNSKAI